ncbi:angiopoietin-1-like [Anopheles ziemanni]|uniref:angiopoietin-1-like n=1 Tax=Anopheles coustani TaxID=139045 RepID=UPI00265A55A7|nr:angiopoietin-1-like [Anopheles coustani]XP_058170659.1 angiopoietin-1-like [Anopheles ziemanni]
MEDSMNGRYETLQDKLDELEQNQTLAKEDVFQELSSTQEKYESLQSTLMELENNITARDDSLQEIERSMKELERNVKERDETQNGKLIEIGKQVQAKNNTLQEMMQNMTILEDHSKVQHEELEANLNKLQNETKNSLELQTELIKNHSIPRSCKDVSSNKSGSYVIYLGNRQFKTVYCEQVAFDGGWVVFQYRFNGNVDFYRTWDEYRDGFGTIDEGPSAKLEIESHGEKLNEMERSLYEKYESLQSTWMELENNITARDDSLQAIERFMKELERNVKERDETQKGILNKIEKQVQANENTLQEMMRNMTRLEDRSKVKHEELEANLNKLQSETKNSLELQTEVIKNKSIIWSCKDVSSNESGTYTIYLGNGHFKKVYCEQAAYGGGWIVFQYRFNGQVDFHRTWAEYRDGFGTIDSEFWLGLKYLHLLTSTRKQELMVEVKDYDGNYIYAKYDHFEIGSEAEKFVLKVGNYSGTAEDSMTYSQGTKFSTKDSDNDNHSTLQCAEYKKGAWWHNQCSYANLNGPYGNLEGDKAMYWYHFKNDYRGMAYTRMMLREID